MKYPHIAAHSKQFSVQTMCRALGVARSGYSACIQAGHACAVPGGPSRISGLPERMLHATAIDLIQQMPTIAGKIKISASPRTNSTASRTAMPRYCSKV